MCDIHRPSYTVGWGNQGRYPTRLDFVTRLIDVASVEIMHKLLKDAVWHTIIQAWIDNMSKNDGFSIFAT